MPAPAIHTALQSQTYPGKLTEVRFCFYPRTCRYYVDPVKECTCPATTVTRYQKHIFGPLLDRIDTLRDIKVPCIEYEKLSGDRMGEPPASDMLRILAARAA